MSWADLRMLDAVEFVALLFGLSPDARLVAAVSATAATVTDMPVPQTADELIERLGRHPGALVEVVTRGR